MTSKIDDALLEQLEVMQDREPQQRVPVIVRVRSDADIPELERHGLQVDHRYQSIPAVAGTLPASQVGGLAQLEQVERIDYDAHSVRALESDGR